MAGRTEALVLEMSAKVDKLEKAMNQARGITNRQLGAIEKRFDQTNAHVRRSGDQMARDLRASIAAIGAGFAIRELTNAADSWTNLRNQVKQYSDVVGPVGEATARLTDVANDAGVAVTSLGTTFAASARAAKTLGASADQVFAFNEAVAKGAAIANTGIAAVDGALTQLGQAIGSPKVQLGEFNSVIEGTPRLAQAFADGIADAEGSVAKLRALIAKGDISGADLFAGLLSQLPKLRTEFSQTEATVGRSMARLGNAFTQYVGEANTASGVTRTLAGFIDQVAENFGMLADAAVVAASVLGGTLAAGAIVRLIGGLTAMIGAAAGAGSALAGLRIALTFFTGPIGGVILAIGAALGTLALNANRARPSIDQLEATMGKLEDVHRKIQDDTKLLTTANDNLKKAIESQGPAAENVARMELAAIAKRIEGNKRLAAQYKSQLLSQLNDAREAQLGRGGIDEKRIILQQNLSSMGVTQQQFLAGVDAKLAAGQQLSTYESGLLDDIVAIEEGLERINDLRLRLREIDNPAAPAAAEPLLIPPAAVEESKTKLRQFTTALEEYRAVMRTVRASEEDRDAKSRATVQAIVDYARATNDAAGAMELLHQAGDLVTGFGDWALVTAEIVKIRDAAAETADTWHSLFGKDVPNPKDSAPDFDFVDESKELRDAIREATKQGLREGITTGNWGEALSSILAEAIVQGMDESLNRFADLLTNALLGSDGKSGWLEAIGSFFAGGRATGGPVSGGNIYRVGENGPEYLAMGRGQNGQVITAAQMNRMSVGGQRGGVSIATNLIIQGDLTESTLAKVQRMIDINNRRVAAAFPASVNGVLIDNRKQQRRL